VDVFLVVWGSMEMQFWDVGCLVALLCFCDSVVMGLRVVLTITQSSFHSVEDCFVLDVCSSVAALLLLCCGAVVMCFCGVFVVVLWWCCCGFVVASCWCWKYENPISECKTFC